MIFDLSPPAILHQEPSELRADAQLSRLGLPRHVRRAILAEVRRAMGAPPNIFKPTIEDLASYGGADAAKLSFIFAPGFRHRAAAAAAAASFTVSAVDATDLTTYDFTAQDFGAAASDRYIVVAYAGHSGTATVSSATIGGVSATKINEVTRGTATTGFLIAAVPTGTTGTVSITWSAGQSRMGIGNHRVTGLNSATPTATAQDNTSTGSSHSASLTINTDGFGIGVAFASNSTAAPFSWTNLTENYDQEIETGRFHTGALSSTAGAATRTVTGADNFGAGGMLNLAAWR